MCYKYTEIQVQFQALNVITYVPLQICVILTFHVKLQKKNHFENVAYQK